MGYRAEFPDFDPATMPVLPEGFEDQSWHNDTMPHFTNDALGLDIWIDYAKAEDRESQEEGQRFQVYSIDEDGQWLADVPELHTDDWNAVLHKVADVMMEMERQAPTQSSPRAAVPANTTGKANTMKVRVTLSNSGGELDAKDIEVKGSDADDATLAIHEAIEPWILSVGDTITITEA